MDKRKLAIQIRFHFWACGCRTKTRAVYTPKTVQHDEKCGSCLRLIAGGQAMVVARLADLQASMCQSISDAARAVKVCG
jgi:hypothetical protein